MEVRIDCPEKYVGENRYITTWEKEMMKAIDKQIDEELKRHKENEKKGVVKVLIIDDYYRENKTPIYEAIYRRNRILNILANHGLNVEEFLKTKMGSSSRTNMLLDCVQDKIDGFDYDENEIRIPNNRKMDVDKLHVEYEEGILRIDDGTYINEFKFDEHMLIYVNGENVFKKSLTPIRTREEDNRDTKNFMDDLHTERLAHEKKMERSLEYAKTWRVEI